MMTISRFSTSLLAQQGDVETKRRQTTAWVREQDEKRASKKQEEEERDQKKKRLQLHQRSTLQIPPKNRIPHCASRSVPFPFSSQEEEEEKVLTIPNNPLRRLRIRHIRKMRIQHPPVLVIPPMHLKEMSSEVLDDGFVVV